VYQEEKEKEKKKKKRNSPWANLPHWKTEGRREGKEKKLELCPTASHRKRVDEVKREGDRCLYSPLSSRGGDASSTMDREKKERRMFA